MQGPVFLVNSRQRNFNCGPADAGQVLLQAYDRFIAEFLNEESPVRLGTLTPTYLCRFAVRIQHF